MVDQFSISDLLNAINVAHNSSVHCSSGSSSSSSSLYYQLSLHEVESATVSLISSYIASREFIRYDDLLQAWTTVNDMCILMLSRKRPDDSSVMPPCLYVFRLLQSFISFCPPLPSKTALQDLAARVVAECTSVATMTYPLSSTSLIANMCTQLYRL